MGIFECLAFMYFFLFGGYWSVEAQRTCDRKVFNMSLRLENSGVVYIWTSKRKLFLLVREGRYLLRTSLVFQFCIFFSVYLDLDFDREEPRRATFSSKVLRSRLGNSVNTVAPSPQHKPYYTGKIISYAPNPLLASLRRSLVFYIECR